VTTTVLFVRDSDEDRDPDQKGDRAKVTMSGKFLPYKRY
jgi:cyanate lyase